jgi:hypothetical protein
MESRSTGLRQYYVGVSTVDAKLVRLLHLAGYHIAWQYILSLHNTPVQSKISSILQPITQTRMCSTWIMDSRRL